MKIIHLSTSDVITGAGRAAYRLNIGLRKIFIESKMLVLNKYSDDESVEQYMPEKGFFNTLKRFQIRRTIRQRFSGYKDSRNNNMELFSDSRSQYLNISNTRFSGFDVINLHWATHFVDCSTLFRCISTCVPVVVTLHDMNPFTGGCHYNEECRKFESKCGACPQLESLDVQDLSARILQDKKNAYFDYPIDMIKIVAPSRWIGREAKLSSILGNYEINVIPNSLDTDVFYPLHQSRSRKELEIPCDAKVILFVAGDLNNKRKGMKLLEEALDLLDCEMNYILLTLGRLTNLQSGRTNTINFGEVHDDKTLQKVYSAADIFVVPSMQDNLPNTVLESMACGTPVVAFNIGGIPDMVREGETGLLVEENNPQALAKKILYLLKNEEHRNSMRDNCRNVAVNEYSDKIQAEKYKELYASFSLQ